MITGLHRTFAARFLVGAAVLASIYTYGSIPSLAQAQENNVDILALLPSLPLPQEGQPLQIDLTNAHDFKPLIIPELYQLVRDGAVELEAFRDGNPPAATPPRSSEQALSAVASSYLDDGLVDLGFTLFTLKDSSLVRQFEGRLVRFFPKKIIADDKTVQLFREIIRIHKPQSIAGFTWLTFRFPGNDADAFWLYSPANQKGRELTGSIRSDGILHSSMSPDDLFGWSGKAELVETGAVSSVHALVFFPSYEPQIHSRTEHCIEILRESPDGEEGRAASSAQWNFGGRSRPRGVGWLPLQAFVVPRDLLRFELQSRDPYSHFGRQVLYLDRETGLPTYRFAFDRAGRPWKLVVSAFGSLATGEQQNPQRPYPAFTIVHDFKNGESSVFDIQAMQFCKAFPADLTRADFDPHRFGDWQNPASANLPSPTPSVADSPRPVEQVTTSQISKPPFEAGPSAEDNLD